MAQNCSSRRGISLMEVLISMFVLAIGLLGVAALIPAGRHEIVEATKLETAALVGRNAFKDIQIRGYLRPDAWQKFPTSSSPVYDPTQTPPFTVSGHISAHLEYALDPLGSAAGYNNQFPNGAALPLRRIVPFFCNNITNAKGAYDVIFRSSLDLVTEKNAVNKDLPPIQKYFEDAGTKLRRASNGDYSWMATIVSDQSRPAIDAEATVSVAVFYKRDLSAPNAGEHVSIARPFTVLPLTSGGEMVVANLPTVNGKKRGMKPGQWFMMAGIREILPTPVPPPGVTPPSRLFNYFRWYRVLSAAPYDAVADEQKITVAGQDWPIQPTGARPVQVWIFDNIVNVYEKSMPLEFN